MRYDKCHDGAICSVTFDTENNWLVTGSYDGTVKLWSQEGRCLDVFDGLADTVTGTTLPSLPTHSASEGAVVAVCCWFRTVDGGVGGLTVGRARDAGSC